MSRKVRQRGNAGQYHLLHNIQFAFNNKLSTLTLMQLLLK